MSIFRVVMIVAATLSIGGAAYLSYHGIGRESSDLDRSIRVGSAGNTFTNTSVK